MTNKWILDPAHSELFFKVKHLMITTVTGYFKKFTVEAFTEGDDFTTVSGIVFTADVDSIDSNNKQRDEHLKSADFLNAQEYKQVHFEGTKYEVAEDDFRLSGKLILRGTAKEVLVNVEFGGIVVDGYGQTKAGFTVSGKINRKDFGLTWGAVTEAGNVVVGDEVKFHGEIQMIKQA